MPTKIIMPQLGESLTEGTIGKWLKKEGDYIKKYEPLVEVITEKVNVEVPSPAEGIIQQLIVPEGQTVPVGTELALVQREAEEAAAPTTEAAPTAPPPTAAAPP